MELSQEQTLRTETCVEIAGNHFVEAGSIYIAITATLENLGAASLVLDEDGTYCELLAVYPDLSTQSLRLFEVFTLHDSAEPGESIDDRFVWCIENPPPDIVWLRIDLRVQSGTIEWNTSAYERILRDGIAKKPERTWRYLWHSRAERTTRCQYG